MINLPKLPHVLKDSRRKVTPEMIKEMKKLHHDGMNYSAIARKFGMTRGDTVRYNIDPVYREHYIQLQIKKMKKRRKNPKKRAMDYEKNNLRYHKLLSIPSNRKKMQKYSKIWYQRRKNSE